jgi:four helix bundle protein
MATLKRFEDLKVWKEARVLNQKLFVLLLEKDASKFGFLVNHIFKTSGSIMDNIAEGFEREGNKELIQFLSISKGSTGELRSQLYRAFDLRLITSNNHEDLIEKLNHISAQLSLFISYLKKSEYKGNKFKEPSMIYNKFDDTPFYDSNIEESLSD